MSCVTGLLAALEAHPARVLWSLGTLFVVVYIGSLTIVPGADSRIINGDAIQYYSYLRSLAVDGDLDFTNDYRLLYPTSSPDAANNVWLTTVTATGRPRNMMSLGPALLWAPAFLFVATAAAGLRLVGLGVPYDGIAVPFQLSAGVAGILYATAGVHLCYDMCRRLFPAVPALWATLTAWLATSAVYYSLVSPTYSHAVSLFAVALFCHTWLRTRDRDGLWRTVTLGALAGLAGLVRWQDIIVLILPVGELAVASIRRTRSASNALGHVAVLGASAMLVLVPQLLAWQAIYGQPLIMPQGEGFMQWTSPAVGPVLFSLKRGIFTWTPAVLLAVIGWRALIRRDALLGWSAVGIGLLALYVNAAVIDWWAGEAFGARRFISYTPFLALGLGEVFSARFWKERPAFVRWTAIGLSAYNLLFVLQYQLFLRGFSQLANYPTTAGEVFVERLIVPWRLVRLWLG
jgi:hypothetical protein